MNKIIALVAVLSFVVPSAAFADSTVTASAGTGASITPSGSVVVPTGVTQTFSIGASQGYRVSDVAVDGVSQGAVHSVGFTGIAADATSHSIFAMAAPTGGGALPWCSGPMAPGWNVSLANGGCGTSNTLSLSAGQTLTLDGVVYSCPLAFGTGCQVKR